MNGDLKLIAEVLEFACINKYSSLISGILCEHLKSREEFDSLPRDCQDRVLIFLIQWIVRGRRFSLFQWCLTILKLLRVAHPHLYSRKAWGKLELGIKLKIVLEQLLNGSGSSQCLETFQQLFPTFDKNKAVHGSSEWRLPYLLHQLITHPSQRAEASADVTFQQEVGSNLVGTISHRVKHLSRNLDGELAPPLLQRLRVLGLDALPEEDWEQLSEESQGLFRMAVEGTLSSAYLMKKLHLSPAQNDDSLVGVITRLFGPGEGVDSVQDSCQNRGASGGTGPDSDHASGLPASSFYSRRRGTSRQSSPTEPSMGCTEVRSRPEMSVQRNAEAHPGMSEGSRMRSHPGMSQRRKLESHPRMSGQEGSMSFERTGRKLKSKEGMSEGRNLRTHPKESEESRPNSHPGMARQRNLRALRGTSEQEKPEARSGISERGKFKLRYRCLTPPSYPKSGPENMEDMGGTRHSNGKDRSVPKRRAIAGRRGDVNDAQHAPVRELPVRCRALSSQAEEGRDQMGKSRTIGSNESQVPQDDGDLSLTTVDTEGVLKLACRRSKLIVELRKLPMSVKGGDCVEQGPRSRSSDGRSPGVVDLQDSGSEESGGGRKSMEELFSSDDEDCIPLNEVLTRKRKNEDSCNGRERAKRVKRASHLDSQIITESNSCKENIRQSVSPREREAVSRGDSGERRKKKPAPSPAGVDAAVARRVCAGIENVDVLNSSTNTGSVSTPDSYTHCSKESREKKRLLTGSFYSRTRPPLRNYRWRSPSRKVEIPPPPTRPMSPRRLISPTKDTHSSSSNRESSEELLVVGSFYSRSLPRSTDRGSKSPDKAAETVLRGKPPSPGTIVSPGKDSGSSKESSEELLVVGSFYSQSLPRLRNYRWRSPLESRGKSLQGANSGVPSLRRDKRRLNGAERTKKVIAHEPPTRLERSTAMQSHLGEDCMDGKGYGVNRKGGDDYDSSQDRCPNLTASPVFKYMGSFSGSSNEGSISMLTGRRVLFSGDCNETSALLTSLPEAKNPSDEDSRMQREYDLLFEFDGSSESEVPGSGSLEVISETPPCQGADDDRADAPPPLKAPGGSSSGSPGSKGNSRSNCSDYQNAQKPDTITPSLPESTPDSDPDCVPTSDEEEEEESESGSWKRSRFPSLTQHLREDEEKTLRPCSVPLAKIKLEEMRMRVLLSSESSCSEFD